MYQGFKISKGVGLVFPVGFNRLGIKIFWVVNKGYTQTFKVLIP